MGLHDVRGVRRENTLYYRKLYRNFGSAQKIKCIGKPQHMLVLNQRLKSYRCDGREIFLSEEEEEEEDGVLDGAEEGGDVEEGEDGGERLVCKNQI